MIARVGDVQLAAVGTEEHRLRSTVLSDLGAVRPEAKQILTLGGKHLDAIVAAAVLGNVQATIRPESDISWIDELAGPFAVPAEPHQLVALAVVGDDALIVRIGDEDSAIGGDANTGRLAVFSLRHPPLELRPAVEPEPLHARRFVHDVDELIGGINRQGARVIKLPQGDAGRTECELRPERLV